MLKKIWSPPQKYVGQNLFLDWATDIDVCVFVASVARDKFGRARRIVERGGNGKNNDCKFLFNLSKHLISYILHYNVSLS